LTRSLYLDASALVKLAADEPETDALERYLSDRPRLLTSEISEIEVARAARRAAPNEDGAARGSETVGRCTRIALDATTKRTAAIAAPFELGTLDAIHLASALRVASILDAFVTYDRQLAAAARDAGLTVVSPGRVS
jgi:predicted nucleic acid-binding protein